MRRTWEDVHSRIWASPLFNGPGGKFIVVLATLGQETKRIVWATGQCNHVSLDEQCSVQLRDRMEEHVRLEVIGGGEVRGDYKTCTFYIWGESPEYGREPDREKTVEEFDQFFTNWKAIDGEPPEGVFDYYLEACRERRDSRKQSSSS